MRQTRDLARVGWRGLRWKARKHALRLPLLPIGPRERPRLADSFSRLGQARGASPGSLDQRSEEWPLCEGKSGALDASVRPSEGGRELRGPHGRLSSALSTAPSMACSSLRLRQKPGEQLLGCSHALHS